jgi:hypothetical protein
MGAETVRRPMVECPANSGRPKVWRAMRVMHKCEGSFSVGWLAALTETKPSAVLTFVNALLGAGVVRKFVAKEVRDAVNGKYVPAGTRFAFVRDLGPKTPVVRRVYEIYDPNSNTTLPRVKHREAV